MPPKKTLKSVIPKTASAAKPAAAKPPTKDAKKTTNASEIDDIFSTGVIPSSSPSKPAKAASTEVPKKTSKSESKKNVKDSKKDSNKEADEVDSSANSKTSKNEKEQTQSKDEDTQDDGFDDVPMGESLDDSEEEDVNPEDLYFDEDELNESEETALAKLMAKKKKSTDAAKPAKEADKATAATAVTVKPRSGAKVVEAVVFNERPAAAAAAAAAAKIQKFKRARNDGPDSDDELEKNGKRRTDDGLRLFDINDLNIGKGGDTEKCPFDCECCY
ncbi:hypothetical protein BGX20_003443 [Mortierella sp. AD010]|nr:hypothetical protein BGX20_003443 [Mortierella sp. AD010]